MDKKRVTELSIIANNVRKNALTAVYNAASGHPGGSLSIADVLTLLYFEVMNVDPKNPKMENRDRFVLNELGGLPLQVTEIWNSAQHGEQVDICQRFGIFHNIPPFSRTPAGQDRKSITACRPWLQENPIK